MKLEFYNTLINNQVEIINLQEKTISLESLVSTLSDNSLTLSPVMKFWFDLLNLQLPVQSAPITTKAMSLNPVHGEAHSIQNYVIKFVSDLGQVGGFLQLLQFSTPITLTARYNWNIVESGVKHKYHKLNLNLSLAKPDQTGMPNKVENRNSIVLLIT